MFNSGAGVEVVENAGHMTVRVYMPWEFIVGQSTLFIKGNIVNGLLV